jgi:hypothetical protein
MMMKMVMVMMMMMMMDSKPFPCHLASVLLELSLPFP